MNKLFCFITVFLSIVVWTGCKKETAPSNINEEKITVSLNLVGDFNVEVSQDPITKGEATADAYAINVYYDKEGNGTQDDIYAYGLFDNVSDMHITLLSNHQYSFRCTLVKDARNTLFFGQAFNNTFSGYAYPFQTNSSNSTMVNNAFVVGSTKYFSGFNNGSAHMAATTSPSTSNATSYPNTNRFYGETSNYVPVQNGVITIYLKRVVFGARFIISGHQNGSLNIKCGDFFNRGVSNGTYESIYTFPNPVNVWQNETPIVATLTATYTSSWGSLWNLTQSQDIQFKRNVMTTVNIQINPDLSAAQFSISEEEIGDDNNIDLGINTDGLIDIIVNPED